MIQSPTDGLVVIESSLEQALHQEFLDIIFSHIQAGAVVLLQGAVTAETALRLRDDIVSWRQKLDVISFSEDTNKPGLNFHRIDADPEKSQLPHIFHQHGFGALDALEGDLAQALLAIAGPMLALQNALAKTHFRLGMPEVRIKVLQYPRGGGFLMKHVHPIDPQGVGLILALSQAGTDFSTGGTTFVTPFGFVDTSPYQDAGDLILFRYDLEHAVSPVDVEAELEWTRKSGRWTLVLELLSTHRRSEAA